MAVANNILIGGTKAQQVAHFGAFIRDKYHITLDELDGTLPNTDLKTWIDTWWDFDLGLVSAFVSFGVEEEYLKASR